MSIDVQKAKAEAHENAAKQVANMLQVRPLVLENLKQFVLSLDFILYVVPKMKSFVNVSATVRT